MAVYTDLGAEALGQIVAHYDIGTLVSAKGIAEGVSNSNWLIETTGGDGAGARFILTMYERRIEIGDLPFFLGLLDHLADRHCPVPRTIHDREGQAFRFHEGKAIALIEFLPGVSVSHPTPAQARATGAAMGRMHRALADFPGTRPNALGVDSWPPLFERCGAGLDEIDPTLREIVADGLDGTLPFWNDDGPRSVIHADLFPDNVLMLGDEVTGLIDFYFACTDLRLYDLAVAHSAWSFDATGARHDAGVGRALLDGYAAAFGLSGTDRRQLHVLAMGACLRFTLTRAWDWLNTPPSALVTRKDPMAYARRLAFYQAAGTTLFA